MYEIHSHLLSLITNLEIQVYCFVVYKQEWYKLGMPGQSLSYYSIIFSGIKLTQLVKIEKIMNHSLSNHDDFNWF
jgi:hypothetical protein